MDDLTNEQINKVFGMIFQTYRQKNNLTQEKTEYNKILSNFSYAEQVKKSLSEL